MANNNDTLEIIYIDVKARETSLDADLSRITQGAKTKLEQQGVQLGQAVSRGLGQGAAGAGAAAKQLADQVDALSISVRNTRASFVAGFQTEEQYKTKTTELKNEIEKLINTEQLSAKQKLQLNNAAATAERGLATLRGEVSRLGIAQQLLIAQGSNVTRMLNRLGPVGAIAADVFNAIVAAQGKAAASSVAVASAASAASAATASVGVAGGAAAAGLTATGAAGVTASAGLATARASAGLTATVVGGTLVAALLLGVTGLIRMADKASEVAEEILLGSQKTGLSIETYQELGFAASQAGVGQETLVSSLSRLNRLVGDAAGGNKIAAKTFRDLDISLEDVNGTAKSTEQIFLDVVDRISGYPTAAAQASAGNAVFGRGFAELLPLIQGGSEGINEARQRAVELGLVLSGDAVISLETYGDEMATVRQQLQTTGIQITATFLPILRDGLIPLLQNSVVPWLQSTATWLENMRIKFVDTGGAGDTFRGQLANMLAPMQSFGQYALGAGLGFSSFANYVLGGVAFIGGALGDLSVQLEQYLPILKSYSQALIGDYVGAYNTVKDINFSSLTLDFNQTLASASAASSGYFATAQSNSKAAFAAFQTGSSITSESVAANLGSIAGSVAGGGAAFRGFAEDGEDAFNTVSDAAGKTRDDVLAATRVWTQRLQSEVEQGLRGADSAAGLLSPRLEELRGKLAAAYLVGDLEEYNEVLGKIELIDDALDTIAGRDIKIKITPVLAVDPEQAVRQIPVPQVTVQRNTQAQANAVLIDQGIFTGGLTRRELNAYRKRNESYLELAELEAQALETATVRSQQTYEAVAAEQYRQLSLLSFNVGQSVIGYVTGIVEASQKGQAALDAAKNRQKIVDEFSGPSTISAAPIAAQLGAGLNPLGANADLTNEQKISLQLQAQALTEANRKLQDFSSTLLALGSVAATVNQQTAKTRDTENTSAINEEFARQFEISKANAEAIKKEQEAAAKIQQDAADQFASTVVSASFDFANSVIQGIQDGDIGSIIKGGFSAASSIAGAADFGAVNILGGLIPGGSLISAGIGLLGGLVGSLFPKNRDQEERKRSESERNRTVPAITIAFNFDQTNTYNGGPKDASNEQAFRKQAQIAFEEFYTRALGPRLDRLEKAIVG